MGLFNIQTNVLKVKIHAAGLDNYLKTEISQRLLNQLTAFEARSPLANF